MTPNSWWKHSLLYEVDSHSFQPPADGNPSRLKEIAASLDDSRALGVDGLLLANLAAPVHSEDYGPSRYLDPSLGTVDDFDDLLRQASSHDLRLLIALPADLSDADLLSTARFWLNRGVAGFRLLPGGEATAQAAHLAQLRGLVNGYVGERVVIGDLPPQPAVAARGPHGKAPDGPQLFVLPLSFSSQNGPANLRLALQQSEATAQTGSPQPLLEAKDPLPPDLSRIAATVLLGGRSATLLHAGQGMDAAASGKPAEASGKPAEVSGKPAKPATLAPATPTLATGETTLAGWYRQMSVLHHSSPALRQGTSILLDHDDQNVLAWVRKPQQLSAMSPPLVFVCNLSDKPVQLSLKPDMTRLRLRGSFLRTVLRSDDRMGPMGLDTVTLQPYGVYIGELRY